MTLSTLKSYQDYENSINNENKDEEYADKSSASCKHIMDFKLPWRNWLARSAVNRKAGGSSPPGSDGMF